jgi:hypothetical protein
MRLLQALRNQSTKMQADFENSGLFTHMGDRGSFRETIIKDFLRPFLPDCYGLGSGEVFSVNGAQSAQVDIVVYDAVFSTVLFRSGPQQLFPAESVFGSIEVKSNLTTPELSMACENIASVKRLDRPQADTLDLLPSVRLELGAGLTGGGDHRNPYLGIAFGHSGIAPELVVAELSRRFQEAPADRQLLPDFVFVAKPGYMVARYVVRDGKHCPMLGNGYDYAEFRWTPTGSDTLPLFFFTLNSCLGHLRLRSVDFQRLWNTLLFELAQR